MRYSTTSCGHGMHIYARAAVGAIAIARAISISSMHHAAAFELSALIVARVIMQRRFLIVAHGGAVPPAIVMVTVQMKKQDRVGAAVLVSGVVVTRFSTRRKLKVMVMADQLTRSGPGGIRS
jgi:hypothetical protein